MKQNIKKSKVLKIFGGVSLAFFMGVSTLCGVMLTPTTAKTSLENLSTNTLHENSSMITFDAENDPTIFTTQSGLEIKFSASNFPSSPTEINTDRFKGYFYFSMGTYNSNPVNWIIIGRHSSLNTVFQDRFCEYIVSTWNTHSGLPNRNLYFNSQYDTNTPAGALLSEKILNSYVVDNSCWDYAKSSTTIDSELGTGEVLVFCEATLGSCVFSGSNADYNQSTLKTNIDNLYKSGLGFTNEQKALIMPKTLTNYFNNGYSPYESTTTNAYLFPLDEQGANFNFYTYLSNSQGWLESKTNWFARSGWKERYGDTNNRVYSHVYGYFSILEVGNGAGIRPAMVVKIT